MDFDQKQLSESEGREEITQFTIFLQSCSQKKLIVLSTSVTRRKTLFFWKTQGFCTSGFCVSNPLDTRGTKCILFHSNFKEALRLLSQFTQKLEQKLSQLVQD